VADEEIGHAFHARRSDQRGRHRMRLDLEAEIGEQLLRARGMTGAIAGRIVGRDLDERGEKRRLAGEVLVDEGFDGMFGGGFL
jgi:hypothetical protein